MTRRTLALLLALSAAAAAAASELRETVESAQRAFLEGRLDDASSAFRYISTLGVALPSPDANLAVLARDAGRHEEALALWVKASLLEGADGFVWNQRGWAYAGLRRPKEAREAFLRAIDRSTTTAMQAEAGLGLAVAALQQSQPKAATTALRAALVQGPYVLSAANYLAGRAALASGDRTAALAYLRESARLDPTNLEALRELARLYERVGENRSAWRLYHRLAGLPGADPEARDRLKRLKSFIPGDAQASLPLRRLARPLLDAAAPSPAEALPSTPTIRVGLYAAPDGRAATATRIYLMLNREFKLIAANGDVIKDDGRGFEQWEVSFRPENNLVEVRDASRNIQYTAKQPFRFVPWDAEKGAPSRAGSALIKSAVFVDSVGVEAGDRELRGSLEISPTPFGFRLINELPLEDYLFGVVGMSLPPGSPPEAYKAQAVVARTLALWHKAAGPRHPEAAEICDSAACLRYGGLGDEMREATRAVADTEGVVLTQGGKLAKVLQHENCGGVTEDGRETGDPALSHLASVHDAPLPGLPLRTPVQVERWLHEFPPRDRFCEAGNAPQTHSRWIRLIDAGVLRQRLDAAQPIGSIRHMRALKRTPGGRVKAVEVEGSRGRFVAEGEAAIAALLSPGTLRSTLFTIQPIMDGRSAGSFILWGAGTGHGLGLCQAGAVGQAVLGRDFKAILSTYFPALALDSLRPKAERPARTSPALRPPRNPKRR